MRKLSSVLAVFALVSLFVAGCSLSEPPKKRAGAKQDATAPTPQETAAPLTATPSDDASSNTPQPVMTKKPLKLRGIPGRKMLGGPKVRALKPRVRKVSGEDRIRQRLPKAKPDDSSAQGGAVSTPPAGSGTPAEATAPADAPAPAEAAAPAPAEAAAPADAPAEPSAPAAEPTSADDSAKTPEAAAK